MTEKRNGPLKNVTHQRTEGIFVKQLFFGALNTRILEQLPNIKRLFAVIRPLKLAEKNRPGCHPLDAYEQI
ncbi:MAG: hypothetical protein Q4E12_07165 [Coriobacteriia bacterium]|nr:hypothetical protein [Coriobacteriia bacterium]